MKKKKISTKHLSLASLALLIGVFLGLLPVYFKSTQHVSAAPPDKRIVGTFTIPAGSQDLCPTRTDPAFDGCILSQVAVANPPVSIDCVFNFESTGDPTLDGVWHGCDDAQDNQIIQIGLEQLQVFWRNGNLQVLARTGSTMNNPGPLTITYSAVH